MPIAMSVPPRARSASLILMTATLLAACNTFAGASPLPSTSPTEDPTTTATETLTPQPPTATPVASPTFNANQIAHPTGATEIVLRMEQGGGFVPFEWNITQAPQFTLYGDGTVVFRPVQESGRLGNPGELPRFLTGRLTEDGVQALLNFALGEGRLANAKATYDDAGIADASTTTFNLNAGGEEKVVSVYALSELTQPGADAIDRAGFAKLYDLLFNFQTRAADDMDAVDVYDPEIYRVIVIEGQGEPASPPVDWPWEDVSLDDWPPAGDDLGRITHLDKAHVDKLVPTPNGGQFGIWVQPSDEDEAPVQFAIRPLLPDEVATSRRVKPRTR